MCKNIVQKGDKLNITWLAKLKRLGLFFLLGFFFTASVCFPNKLMALESSIIRVNGTIIYDTTDPALEPTGGYNEGHGISGVSYNAANHTLDLTSASLESIYANGDLTINLSGNNAVDALTSNIAVEARGNLTIIGSNGSALSIMAMSEDDRAIEIIPAARLTIGDETNLTNLITVSITRGRNVNTGDTYIVGDNTYNYTEPGGGEDPEGPPPGDPLTISIDGALVIDETADPQITSNAGEGWAIEQGFMGIYQLTIDQGVTLGYLTGTGDGALSIIGDANIAENVDGFSINMNGRVNIFGGMNDIAGDLHLIGGIYTEGMIETYDRDFTIGSVEAPSTNGIVAEELKVSMGDLTIYTTGIALSYYNPAPAEGEGLIVESSAGHSLDVVESDTATANVATIRVSGGGDVELNYTTELGTFTPEASHWPWIDMTGTEEENPLPITVTCVEGTSVENKYQMTTGVGSFLLESTAGTLYQLGWNIPGADDSIVTNGTVRVIAANGYRFTSGGYTDYSIEAGSEVTIELLPDYGYQYVSGGLNGNQTQPEDGKASYSFIMPEGHLHLSAIFEPNSDIIEVNDETVTGASIDLPEGEINGNAQFVINDLGDANEAAFEEAAGDLTVGDYVDLSLNEVIYKGTEEEAWTTGVTELGSPMEVTLELDDSLRGYTDYAVLREHGGDIDEIEADYDSVTGKLTFETDSFSDYAIAYGDRAVNPDTSDNSLSYVVLALLSVIGLSSTIWFIKRKKVAVRI